MLHLLRTKVAAELISNCHPCLLYDFFLKNDCLFHTVYDCLYLGYKHTFHSSGRIIPVHHIAYRCVSRSVCDVDGELFLAFFFARESDCFFVVGGGGYDCDLLGFVVDEEFDILRISEFPCRVAAELEILRSEERRVGKEC